MGWIGVKKRGWVDVRNELDGDTKWGAGGAMGKPKRHSLSNYNVLNTSSTNNNISMRP